MNGVIGVRELQNGRTGGRQLVDVRSSTAFAAGHIPGAISMPMETLEYWIADLHPKSDLARMPWNGSAAVASSGCGV